MPLKLNVGLSRKMADNNYGSRGASVNVELEVESALVSEPSRLKERIRQIFGLVRDSLLEELNGGNGKSPAAAPKQDHPSTEGNGTDQGDQRSRNQPRPATQSQVRAIQAIAKRQQIDLDQLIRQRFQVRRAQDLSIREASQLIDDLKATTP